MGRSPLALALATYFVVIGFYTSLAALSPTPPVGYLFATPAVASALVAALVLATLVAGASLIRARRGFAGPSLGILAPWIGTAALASLLGFDPRSGLAVVGMMLMGAVFHLALVRHYGRPGVRDALLGAYLGVGLGASLAALVMVATRRPEALWALNHGRAAGFFVTANQFAAYLIALLFIALGVGLGASGNLRRLGAVACAGAFVALVASFSQAAWLGAAAGGVFFAFAVGARRVALGLVVAGLIATIVVVVRPTAGHDPAESFDRLRVWQAGVRVLELFPLTGVGPMTYFRVYPAIRPTGGDLPGTFGALHPHDAYLSLAGETGIVGLAAATLGWWRFGRAMRSRLLARPAEARFVGLGVCAALVAVLVQGIFDTIGVVEMAFVWIPYTALALASTAEGVTA